MWVIFNIFLFVLSFFICFFGYNCLKFFKNFFYHKHNLSRKNEKYTVIKKSLMRDSILQLEKNSKNLKKKNLIYLIYVFPLSTLGILLIDVLPQTIGQVDYHCVNNIQLQVGNKVGEVAFFLRDLIFLLSCSLVGYFFFFLPILKSKPRRGVFTFFTPL